MCVILVLVLRKSFFLSFILSILCFCCSLPSRAEPSLVLFHLVLPLVHSFIVTLKCVFVCVRFFHFHCRNATTCSLFALSLPVLCISVNVLFVQGPVMRSQQAICSKWHIGLTSVLHKDYSRTDWRRWTISVWTLYFCNWYNSLELYHFPHNAYIEIFMWTYENNWHFKWQFNMLS